jgi:uncharacterized protein YdhG (YjbR/CyaY superfamily)
MDRANTPITNIDQYIAQYPPEVQKLLTKLRKIVRKIVPAAEETIAYGIPTFRLNGTNMVHFAAYKSHLGFYPTSSVIKAFKKEITQYVHSTGTIRFPLDQPIPFDLIREIVKFRVREINRPNISLS